MITHEYSISEICNQMITCKEVTFLLDSYGMIKKLIKSKSKDRTSTEEKLLLAAEAVFSKLGFKGATTRKIAAKADINLSLINRYFDGKYGLFIAMVERKVNEHKVQELNYPPQDTVTKELCQYSESYIKKMIKDKNLFRIILGQFVSDQKFLNKFRNIVPLNRESPQLEARLQRLIDEGKMTDQYPLAVIIDEIESYAVSLCITRVIIHGQTTEEVAKAYRDFVVKYSQALLP